jgi:hypothetical protein
MSTPKRDRRAELGAQLEHESSDGLKLLADLESNPICCVGLDRTVPSIAVVWKGYATRTQLRYVHECILDLLNKHQISKLLCDDTALPTIHAEDQEWIAKDWMPRSVAAGLRAIGNKRPVSHFGSVSVESVKSIVPSGLAFRSFDSLADAKRWLLLM